MINIKSLIKGEDETMRTKKEELWDWCIKKKIFSYVEVNNYKQDNFYLRADRTIREFVEEGILRRIPEEKLILMGLKKVGRASLAWFEIK